MTDGTGWVGQRRPRRFCRWRIEFAQYAARLAPIHLLMFPAILDSAFHGAWRDEEAMAAARAAVALSDREIEPYAILAVAGSPADR